MLSTAEINAGTSPLTRTKVRALDAILRNSLAYEANKARFSGVYAALLALETAANSAAGVESSDDSAIKAKSLDTILSLLPAEVGRGTVAKQGGDAGTDYSQVRDREDLIRFALGLLFGEEERSDEPPSNYVAVLPQSAAGCSSGPSCRCGFIQCPVCRSFVA